MFEEQKENLCGYRAPSKEEGGMGGHERQARIRSHRAL